MEKSAADDFLKIPLNCAIVFQGDLETIQQIKMALLDFDIKIIYQRICARDAKLIVTEVRGKNER